MDDHRIRQNNKARESASEENGEKKAMAAIIFCGDI